MTDAEFTYWKIIRERTRFKLEEVSRELGTISNMPYPSEDEKASMELAMTVLTDICAKWDKNLESSFKEYKASDAEVPLAVETR